MVSLAFHTLHFSGLFGGASRALEDIVEAAAGAGFTAIGLDLPVVEQYLGRGGSVDGLIRYGRRLGLRYTDLLPFFASPDGDARAAARPAALAAAVGAPLVIASAPVPMPFEDVHTAFAAAAEVCAAHGRRLAVEYIPHSSLRTLADAVRLGEEIGWDRLGLVVDSYHSLLGGATPEEIAALEAGQIAVVQYSDARTTEPADRPDESRNHRRRPGAGMLPLHDFVAAVRATGYDGVVAAEVLSTEVRETTDLPATVRDCYAALVADWLG
jgi:sugar phosphate isomerase/epimerase